MPDVAAAATPTWRRGLTLLNHPVVYGTIALLIVWKVAAGFKPYEQYVVGLILVYAIIGTGLVLLVGTGGQLSLGHAAFLGVGAYSAANVAMRTNAGLPLELLVAIVIAVFVGIIIGLPSLRLSGLLLAVGTLALGYGAQQIIYAWGPVTGGGTGMTVGRLEAFGSKLSLLGVAVILLGISLFLVHNVLRGRTGRALHAIRTSDTAAKSVGIEVERRRVAAFAMSAALAGVGGVLYAHAVSFLSPDTFSVEFSIKVIIMVIIGGQRRLLGAILGAAFVIGLPEQFRSFQDYEGILYGVILLVIIVFAPGGLVELFDKGVASVKRLVARRTPSKPGTADVTSVAATPDLLETMTVSTGATRDGNGHGNGNGLGTGPAPGGSTASARSADEQVLVSAPGYPLRLDDVHVNFGGVVAVRNVSFSVDPGQVIGLIGPNGAGKTTLFNAMCGVVKSTGKVTFGDIDLSGFSARRRAMQGIGRTFQNLSLHEGLTPIDHVLIGRHRFFRYNLASEMLRLPNVMRSEREGRREAEVLLDLLGLSSVANERVDDLPYGIQKRVDVARALAARPRLLLLDEPAAGLPHDEADELIDHVLELTSPQGTSVVIIEHNVDLVRRVCERLVVLAVGEIIAEGPPEEILSTQVVAEAYLGV